MQAGKPRPFQAQFQTRALPASYLRAIHNGLPEVGCDDEALLLIAEALNRHAQGHEGAQTLGSVFVLLVAAIHAATALPKPQPALPKDHEDRSLSPPEWLLFAIMEHALSRRAEAEQAGVRALFEAVEIDIAKAEHVLHSHGSSLVTYALGPLFALSLGRPSDEQAICAGNSLGKLLRLRNEARTITSTVARFPRPLLIGAFAEDTALGDRFRVALTEAHKPLPNRLPMLSVLGDKRLLERLREQSEAYLLDIERAGNLTSSYDKPLQAIAIEISSEIERKTKTARFFGLAPLGGKAHLIHEIDRAIKLAKTALLEDHELREAWDIQRWGGHFGERTVARMFPCGLVAWALAQAGEDVADKLRALVPPGSIDGYRYFESFSAIPPDADDLGLGLQLTACLSRQGQPIPLSALEWPVELLVRSTAEDGAMPVWMMQGLKEPLPQDAPRWLGPRCLAVSANVLVGLAEARFELPFGYFDRAIGWLLRTWEKEGMGAVFYYGVAFTRFVLNRLCIATEGLLQDEALVHAMRKLKEDIARDVCEAQRVDGGFSGPLSTAFHLAVLATTKDQASSIERAALYLAARQDPDGLYAREPLYITPGKDDLLGGYGSRTVTAAFALYALVCAQKALRSNGS